MKNINKKSGYKNTFGTLTYNELKFGIPIFKYNSDNTAEELYINYISEDTLINKKHIFMSELFKPLYLTIKNLGLDILEMGVGFGETLEILKTLDIKYTIIELNIKLVEKYNNPNIKQGDFFNEIKNGYNNTCFIYRANGTRFYDINEFILFLCKFKNKGINNFLLFTARLGNFNFNFNNIWEFNTLDKDKQKLKVYLVKL